MFALRRCLNEPPEKKIIILLPIVRVWAKTKDAKDKIVDKWLSIQKPVNRIISLIFLDKKLNCVAFDAPVTSM